MVLRMSQMRTGMRGIVQKVELPSEQAGDFLRLGLIRGTEVICLRRCPLGDPTVYRFRGTDAAIRRGEGSRILIEWEPEPAE